MAKLTGKEVRIVALLVLDTAFFLLEAIIGYSQHSLALVADSFHMLNDIISLLIALWAVRMKNNKPADELYTYGWQRAEILGALINAVFLLALCFSIIIEAISRFFMPQVINNPQMVLAVGFAGLLSNGIGLVLFGGHSHDHSHGGSGHGHSHGEAALEEGSGNVGDYLPDAIVSRYADEHTPLVEDSPSTLHATEHSHSHADADQSHKPAPAKSMNMEGVWLHVLGDALGNVGVILVALFIWKTNYSWRYVMDPVVSLVITAIIFSTALPLCRKSSKILLQATPPNVNTNALIARILDLPLVKAVHDVHIWNLNEDILIASLHLVFADSAFDSATPTSGKSTAIDLAVFEEVVEQVRVVLRGFGIRSATIQPEFPNVPAVSQKKSGVYINCLS